MADFCRQCSMELFGKDFGNMKGATTKEDWEKGLAAVVLCEHCGHIQVDPEGNCVSNDCMEGGHKSEKGGTKASGKENQSKSEEVL